MAPQAFVFDAYGTLLDVHAASRQHQALLGEKTQPVSELWRRKQLEYTWLRSLMGAYVDFWQITQDSLAYALEAHHVAPETVTQPLCESYLNLECYAEVPQLLQTLKQEGHRVAILSNGSPNMLEQAVAANELQEHFDAVLSVEKVGIFKPDARVYALVEQELDVTPENTHFFSSNAWDVAGASHFGFQVVWVNRFGQPAERLPGTPKRVVSSLTEWLQRR
jgi:2-haloacid dehalogenase